MFELYDYFRSSASYRVRIVLNYKKCKYTKKEVHLVNDGGQQHSDKYKLINPQELVPSFVIPSDHLCFTQSLAIIEYLEEIAPEPTIFPGNLIKKTEARSLAYLIACDIHPLNNLRVLNYLKDNFKISEDEQTAWYHNWITKGFSSFEEKIKTHKNAEYSLGDAFSLADVCLIPQVYNALRFKVPMERFSRLMEIYNKCLQLDFIKNAAPD